MIIELLPTGQLLCDGAESAHMRSSITVWTSPHSERQFSSLHRVINPPKSIIEVANQQAGSHSPLQPKEHPISLPVFRITLLAPPVPLSHARWWWYGGVGRVAPSRRWRWVPSIHSRPRRRRW